MSGGLAGPELEAISAKLGGQLEALGRLSGGASRVTFAAELEPGARRRPLVLQVERGAKTASALSMEAEADLLALAAQSGVPVPEVLGTGRLPAGRSWMATGRLEGETIARRILREARYASAREALPGQLGRALAAIHAMAPAELPDLPKRDPLANPLALLDELEVRRPALELGMRWLATHPVAANPSTVVHGDYRLGNLIVDEAGLVAVLDWELAHAGDPAEDLGWLCARAWRFGGSGRVAGVGDLEVVLDAYRAAGGQAITEQQVSWWEAFASIKWAAICALQASVHLSGAMRSVELAAIGRRVCESEHDLLARLGFAAKAEPPRPMDQEHDPLGQPSAAQLLEAVREQLGGGRGEDGPTFAQRVTANALAVVERELALGPSVRARHAGRLATLGIRDDAELCEQLRSGQLDGRLEEVAALLAEGAHDQVLIANPAYLDAAV